MSPSTFSWWAAYISDAEKIIFPKYWAEDFGASENDPTTVDHGIDLVPKDDTRYIVLDNIDLQ